MTTHGVQHTHTPLSHQPPCLASRPTSFLNRCQRARFLRPSRRGGQTVLVVTFQRRYESIGASSLPLQQQQLPPSKTSDHRQRTSKRGTYHCLPTTRAHRRILEQALPLDVLLRSDLGHPSPYCEMALCLKFRQGHRHSYPVHGIRPIVFRGQIEEI